ncbi:hypothetical protein LJC61_09860 [Ruminococcaceae bacterium OttesenSCG-928-A16]|nr:hypothetical protein [Ruminococcaceae bacterium OttesenSCG-928-A16]
MKNKGNWFWGIFLILAGVLVLAAQFTPFGQIGLWTIAATILLVGILVKSIVSLEFVGILVPLGLLYSLYQKTFGWPHVSMWVLVAATLLTGLGLSMLFKRRPKQYNYNYSYNSNEIGSAPPNGSYGGNTKMQTEENSDDNHPYAKVSFGSASKYLHSDCLESGQFYSSFGALEVYFDQARLSPNGADIYLDCNLGAIKLYVPRGWHVQENIAATIGGVDNKRYDNTVQPGAPVLRLNGNITLGGIEIQYV